MKLTREERETIIRTSDADETWEVYTDSATWQARLKRRGWGPGPDGRTFKLPLKAVSVRSKAGMEKTRAAAAARKPSLPHLRPIDQGIQQTN